MGRPPSSRNWMEDRRAARLKARIVALGALARTTQVNLFCNGDRLLAVTHTDTRYMQLRVAYLEKTATLIGVYGPRAEDAYSGMMEDCKDAGLL